jgi:hypothetical protein
MPASVNDAPAADAERRLLEALAERYGPAEFAARSAAAELDPALWAAAGVARPDPAAVGRWLRVRKGVVAGHVLANRKNRDGVALWRLRPVETRRPDVSGETSRARPGPRGPAPGRASPETSEVPTSAHPPEPLPAPASCPWWSPPSGPPPAAGGAAERPRGASWWADLGAGSP